MKQQFPILIALFISATMLHGADTPAPVRRPSLDEQLLRDLDNDLLDGVKDPPSKQPAKQPSKNVPEKPAKPLSELDQKLLEQLGEGEDIGQETDPITAIARRMRAVEKLIGQQDTSAQTQKLQQRIVADLTALIEQVKKQQSSGGSGKKSAGQPQGGEGQEGASDKVNPNSNNSSKRVGESKNTKVEADSLTQMLKEVWGHLPPKIRDQLQNAEQPRFLPKYEKLIEEYFKRLAEDGKLRP